MLPIYIDRVGDLSLTHRVFMAFRRVLKYADKMGLTVSRLSRNIHGYFIVSENR